MVAMRLKTKTVRATLGLLLFVTVGAMLAVAPPSAAQTPIVPAPSVDAPAPTLPDDLAPEDVDALLARLTDGDIRSLLRDELARRAEETVAAAAQPSGMSALGARIGEIWSEVKAKVPAWIDAIGSLGERAEAVERRLAMAKEGVLGMVLAVLALFAACWVAIALTFRVTRRWRHWLMDFDGVGYWERLTRALAFFLVLLLPIVAFRGVVRALTPLLQDYLGPLQGGGISYIWIFESGVSSAWFVLALSRRIFAPQAPQLRLANVSDEAAAALQLVVVRTLIIGMTGWLIAGLFPALGYGFPPALATVAIFGTIAYLVMMGDGLLHFSEMSQTTARLFGAGDAAERNVFRTILATAAPWLVLLFFTLAYFYWIGLWISTGQMHLVGPVGTIAVGLALPAFDQLGAETVQSLVSRSERAERYKRVLQGAWRVVLGIAAVAIIARLWGFDLYDFAKGENAPGWASAVFDIGVALLLGQLVWRLIQAALYQERRIAGGDMEDHMEDIAGSSRLSTLIPLVRNALLMIVSVVVFMIVLSSLGVDIGPLLASAGIIGIAIGFGAQTLVRDIFSGIFFLVDDAFRVGEYIELEGDLRGEVEAISVRSLQLRHHRGAVVTIPFGELKNVTNHNRDWVIYKMSFRLEPETDPAVVKKIVKRIGLELLEDPEHGPKFLEPLKSQGVLQIDDDSALIIRVKFKSKPRQQFVLRREVYHRLRAAFAENGIHFARRKVEVVSSGDNASDRAAIEAAAADPQQQGPSGLASANQQL